MGNRRRVDGSEATNRNAGEGRRRTVRPLARRPAETAERRSAAGATTRPETDLRAVGAEERRQTGATVVMAAIVTCRKV